MIIITGASRGIGKYLFEQFQSEAKLVYGTYNHTDLKKENMFKVDIGDYTEVRDWVGSIKDKVFPSHNGIILINCAGNNYNAFAHKADITEWMEVIDINLVGIFNVIREFLPIMRNQRYGRIINLSSVVGQIGVMGTSAYAASKSALTGMIKSIAVENANRGITINNLNLGYFDIGMINTISTELQDVIKDKIPTGKFGNPENIFNAIRFLIESDYVNGASIDINGGIY